MTERLSCASRRSSISSSLRLANSDEAAASGRQNRLAVQERSALKHKALAGGTCFTPSKMLRGAAADQRVKASTNPSGLNSGAIRPPANSAFASEAKTRWPSTTA